MLKVDKSKIENVEAGNGLFLYTLDGQPVKPGKLLGFFPGVIYSRPVPDERANFSILPIASDLYLSIGEHLLYPNYEFRAKSELELLRSKVNEMSIEKMALRRVHGYELNPYAYGRVNFYSGHKINHASGDLIANVVPISIHLDKFQVPHYLLKYMPTVPEVSTTNTQIIMVGFFASKFVPSGSELLMNYAEAFDLYSDRGEERKIEWIDPSPKIDEEYLLKREYYFDVPPTIKKLTNNKLPMNMRLEFTKKHLAMLENNDRLMQAIVDGSKPILPDSSSDTKQ